MFIESVSHNSGWSNSGGRMDVVLHGKSKPKPGKPELNIDPPAGQLSMPKLELQMPNPDIPEITNYKHQITNKFQISISNKIKRQLFGICDLLFEIFYY
jgi:hypothetical protein